MSRPTSFYYAFLVLSRAQREAIIAVWDFCRAVDDTVDEHGSVRSSGPAQVEQVRAQLQAWRDEVDACFTGSPRTAEGLALQPWIPRYHLPRKPFEDLIDGVEMDLTHSRYATFADLYEYCWRVASTVGFVCLAIFGVGEEGREYALNLGLALQLTNILRDVKSDFAAGRVYVPLDDLRRAGCREDELDGEQPTGAVRDVLRLQARRARDFFQAAARSRPAGRRRRLVSAEIMGAIYRELLTSIERRNFDVFSSRVQVSRPRQAAIAAATWLRVQCGLDGA
jgi:phytoene synthase